MVKELGDVGNDLQIYGSKLYATINVSNYIEVMNRLYWPPHRLGAGTQCALHHFPQWQRTPPPTWLLSILTKGDAKYGAK